MSTGRRDRLRAGTDIIQADAYDKDALRHAMRGVTACFHLAAIADVQRCNTNRVECHRVNVGSTVAVFEVAEQLGGVPVVWASSAAVYGTAGAGTRLKETDPTKPISSYGVDKLSSEFHGQVAASFGVPNIGLRFFNVFGPGQDPRSPYSGVLSIFCNRMLERQSITIFGDGHQTRDFVHVTDVVRALLASASYLDTTRATPEAHILNVCTGTSTSLRDILGHLEEFCGWAPDVEFAPSKPGDIRTSCGDPSAMKAILGITANVGVADGLPELLDLHAEATSLAS
jgi:UDP-glucose 4-epimerase